MLLVRRKHFVQLFFVFFLMLTKIITYFLCPGLRCPPKQCVLSTWPYYVVDDMKFMPTNITFGCSEY